MLWNKLLRFQLQRMQKVMFSLSYDDPKFFKVSVLGAAGYTGKCLSLLLKHSDLISELYLYDIQETRGLATDLSHIETISDVRGYTGRSKLDECLKGSDVVIMAAGQSWTMEMTYDKLLEINAPIVKELSEACATVCPNAFVAVMSRPVRVFQINSLVPLVSEVFRRHGVYDPRKILGVCTLHVVRANTFIAKFRNMNPAGVDCPVIGGDVGTTIVPLISHCTPRWSLGELSVDDLRNLTTKIQDAGMDVTKANVTSGPTLSAAYAGARFTNSLLRSMIGDLNVMECAYVRTDVVGSKYLAAETHFSEDGIEEVDVIPEKLTDYERELLDVAIEKIHEHVAKGEKYTH